MSSAPSSSSARAQSIDSAMLGRLLQVELADLVDDLDQLAGDRLVELGRVQADDLELVLEVGIVEPQVQAAALERLGQLAGVVRGQQHDRLGPRLDPPELGNRDLEVADSSSSSIASNSWSVLSISSISSTTGSGEAIAVISGRCEQELLAEDVVLHVLPAGVVGLGLDPQQLLAVVPLVQRLRLVEALVALQAHQRPLAGSGPAPWRARSCRRPPGPRPAPACRAWSPGTTRAPSTRPADSRRCGGRRRRPAPMRGAPASLKYRVRPVLAVLVLAARRPISGSVRGRAGVRLRSACSATSSTRGR